MCWNTASLRIIAPAQASGRRFPPDRPVWHLTLDQIESGTGLIINKLIKPAGEAGSSTYVFDDTNVLYSKLRPYLNKVVSPREAGIATTELVPLRPRAELVDREYLAYYLRSPAFVRFASATVAGAKMPRIIMKKFWDHEVPLPPLREQLRIIEILKDVDKLRKQRTEANTKANRILPALFYEMFGNPVTNMNGEKWTMKQLDAVTEISYGLPDRLDTSLTANDGKRIITISNVNIDGQIDSSVERYTSLDKTKPEKARVLRDDLLFNWRNGSKEHIGKTAIWEDNCPGDVFHVSFLLRIRPKKENIEPYYLWALLNLLRGAGFFSAQSRMQVNSKFNASELSALRIPVPPKKLQENFAGKLTTFRNITNQQANSRKYINTLFETLLHCAFTGDLTAKWREANMKVLLQEMEHQTRMLA